MTVLPVVAREFRVASRRASTYWTRLISALLAVVVGSFMWALLASNSPRQTGFNLFVALAIIAYLYSLLRGSVTTADCLSEEKRDGTLGLLFLTDLKGYDVVFGKLVATSVAAAYGLLAIFPVMSISILMGGVAAAELGRVALVCANNLFLSLSIGMFCSAISNDERKSIALTLGILLILTAGFPALGGWIAYKTHATTPLAALMIPSPGYAAFIAFDDVFKQVTAKKLNYFYASVITTHLFAWTLLLIATWIVPRTWQDKPATSRAIRTRSRWRNLSYGTPEMRAAFRRHLLAINPFYWLGARDRFKTALVWLWLGCSALIWAVGLVKSREDWIDTMAYLCTAIMAHTVLKCWLAMEAPRRFGLDRQSGALELILATPLSVGEIIRGQCLALLRQFGGVAAVVFVVDLLFVSFGLRREYGSRESWILLWFVGTVIFVLDLVTLALLNMWLGLTSRKTTQAGLSGLARVCAVPWFAFLGVMALLAVLESMNIRLVSSVNEKEIYLVWFGLSVVNDILLLTWSTRNLYGKFRLVATQRFEGRAGGLRKWLGWKATK